MKCIVSTNLFWKYSARPVPTNLKVAEIYIRTENNNYQKFKQENKHLECGIDCWSGFYFSLFSPDHEAEEFPPKS